MSVYPYDIDDDTTLIRIDDNVTEISGQNFNQVRDAIFRIEEELGIKPAGTKSDLKEFLGVAHNEDGSIRASALASVGLVTLPIDNVDVGTNAGILESKLNLDYNTSDLHQLICANANLLNGLLALTNTLTVRVNSHIDGGGGESSLRHVLSHIDVNEVPFDIRDPQYQSPSGWTGIKDTDGNLRTGTDLATVLQQINDELVDHQNLLEDAHPAVAISVDTSQFTEISKDATDVQTALNEIDNIEESRFGIHRAIMHSAGVPVDSRSQVIKKLGEDGEVDLNADGYGETVVPTYQVETYVAAFPGTTPVDDVVNGDKIIRFIPPSDSAEKLVLDSQFSQVKPGDILKINYGYGTESQFIIESLRYIPGSDYFVRVNSNNLIDTSDAYARIDRSLFDPNVYGIAVCAPCNATPVGNFPGFYSSITIADPRCASVLGIGFDASQINSEHYKLYLQLYPSGNPVDEVITLPAIDVTGNAGATPGAYTLDSIVFETNNAFRAAGYNFRFLAFQYAGNFGIALSDPFDGAAFSIVNGDWSSGTAAQGAFTKNVIGDANPDNLQYDGLGLGDASSGHASPAYRSSFVDTVDAQRPTKIFHPRNQRYYVSDGSRRDFLRSAVGVFDGYWEATITQKITTINSFETSYTIEGIILDSVGLEPGKTITVQPTITPDIAEYNKADYGRFIIKDVVYQPGCPGDVDKTIITVINSVHASGFAKGLSSGTDFPYPVRIHFGNDTVGFDLNNMIDGMTPSAQDYHRYHEIYVNKNAQTFSHERARLPIQTETGTVLGTKDWHIHDISPKLRGFRDDGSSDFNRYIRLKILSYDSTSGEFTGRIGKRPNPATAGLDPENPGQIATGRKGVPVRFYDNTGNDWIELVFLETGTIASTINVNATADIEIFYSLSLDDELLLLATCELNWDTEDNLLISSVTDKRPIGSISEQEFTQSAKNFITAGDRALHVNGVINDLSFIEISSSDTSALIFNGGQAIVNGRIVNVNNGKVVIPELVETGGSAGSTVDWAICINEFGEFISLPLTSTKTQFFAEAGTGGGTPYYIPSVTFDEIINQRKDLLLLYIVNVTINSVTINSVSDARKFSLNESANITLSLSDDASASFNTIEQLITWASNTSKDKLIVNIKDNLNISSSKDLTQINTNLVLLGDGGVITVTSSIGLIIKDNVTLDGIKFVYNNTASTVVDDNSNLVNEEACIKIVNGSTNIKINNCKFLQTNLSERNPYIGCFITDAGASDIDISNNKFYISENTFNNAIGFVQLGEDRSILTNVNISNNFIDGYQSILLTSENDNYRFTFKNVTILNNTGFSDEVGAFIIGYKESALIGDGSSADNNTYLQISNNHCFGILQANIDGRSNGGVGTGLTGNEIISNNTCSYINAYATMQVGVVESSFIIQNNTLYASPIRSEFGPLLNFAIQFFGNNNYGLIDGNKIFRGKGDALYQYGIYASGNKVNIINNSIIRCFSDYGITYSSGICKNNNVVRDSSDDVFGHIATYTNDVICVDNFIGSRYNDSANTNENVISISSSGAVVDRNINHIQTRSINMSRIFALGTNIEYAGPNSTSLSAFDSVDEIRSDEGRDVTIVFRKDLGSASVYGIIPLVKQIPKGAKVVSVTLDWSGSNMNFWNQGTISLKFSGAVSASVESSLQNISLLNSGTITLSPNSEVEVGLDDLVLMIRLISIEPSAVFSTRNFSINSLSVKYTY